MATQFSNKEKEISREEVFEILEAQVKSKKTLKKLKKKIKPRKKIFVMLGSKLTTVRHDGKIGWAKRKTLLPDADDYDMHVGVTIAITRL